MPGKKQKTNDRFPDELIREWENSDGVNFAIALARTSGWLLHVDWWTQYQGDPVEKMKSLRVYVGTDGDAIYDFHGKKRIQAYNQYTIQPILAKRKIMGGGVASRYYSEEKLWELPLRVKPSLSGIERAEDALRRHPAFLAKMPLRANPHVPAHVAALFTFGKCAVFAAVLNELKGLPAMAISVQRYEPAFSLSKTGFCHSVCVHPDGDWEDAWGKHSPAHILARHGIAAYTLSEEVQEDTAKRLRQNSPQQYTDYEEQARSLLLNT